MYKSIFDGVYEDIKAVDESKEKSSKPMDFKEASKLYGGKEKASEKIIKFVLAGERKVFSTLFELRSILTDSKKDSDPVILSEFDGEISKGAVKQAFREFLGL